jgi:SAM-dependent methyltransferase
MRCPGTADGHWDVGCGEGMLTRCLAREAEEVIGIDLHEPSLALARQNPRENLEYLKADFLSHRFEPGSFDFIASVASLHHMPLEQALERSAELLRPGGTLCHVGLARSTRLIDLACEGLGFFAHRWHRYVLGKGLWEHSAPIVWPPPDTYASVKRSSGTILRGSRFRRHVLFRFSLTWTKPVG